MKRAEILSAAGERIALQHPLRDILLDALEQRVTDIHIDPLDDKKLIRFRVDGILHEHTVLQAEDRRKLLNLIKVSANISIDKTFQPEEGQLALITDDGTHDVRVSIVPVGERTSVSMRIIGGNKGIRKVEELGFSSADCEIVTKNLKQTHGMTLVAGPTGAGKSTTLYALAQAMNVKENVICSIEDPVEYRISGVRQISVNEKHGVTMSEGLRALLRMDPDVVLIGEIRDAVSAVTAARAALTSRTVLASIHAASIRMVLDAMRSLDVPDYLLAGSLHQIIHQDLIRKLCPVCRRAKENDQRALFERAGVKPPKMLLEAVGCDACHQYGYLGRTAIFEVLHVDDSLRQDISARRNVVFANDHQSPVSPLIRDALQKCADGITSLAEVEGIALAHHVNLDDA